MTARNVSGLVLGLALTASVAIGCGSTDGTPMAATTSPTTSSASTTEATSTTPTSEYAPPTPTGPPLGNATMKVTGAGPATIRYQINGGPEQTETNVTLPWEKQYLVYDKLETSVTAEGGDMCSIIMDGNLVSFSPDPSPKCNFAYYG